MNMLNKVKDSLSDPLQTFKYFERFIATFCILIPVLLRATDTAPEKGFRGSISDYVYMPHSYVFGMLMCIAAMLFVFNGAVYYKSEQHMHISWHGQWYNIVLGLSLIGVICFPWKEYSVVHFSFAAIFFVGNAIVTGIFYKDKDKKKSIAMAILTLAAIPFAIAGKISVLAAEWISLTVIGIHFALSTIGMDKQVTESKPKTLL